MMNSTDYKSEQATTLTLLVLCVIGLLILGKMAGFSVGFIALIFGIAIVLGFVVFGVRLLLEGMWQRIFKKHEHQCTSIKKTNSPS